jgi:hypothetical protein
MSNPRLERFAEAYLAMAGQARYRPQAPGDGFGNILLTRKECGDVERQLHRECEAPWLATHDNPLSRQPLNGGTFGGSAA